MGKSYFAFSLAQYLSYRKMGYVVGASSDVVTHALPHLLEREPLDATVGNRDIDLMVEQINSKDYQRVLDDLALGRLAPLPIPDEELLRDDVTGDLLLPCKLRLSTNDLSGAEFATAMRQLSEPNINFAGEPLTKRFISIISQCDGAIAIVDLVRSSGATNLRQNRDVIRHTLAEQVVPLIRGIALAISNRNTDNRLFPLFLVFTKRGQHQLQRKELYEMVNEIFAIMIAQFEKDIRLRIHAVTNLGFIPTANYLNDSEGIGFFLADLYAMTERM